MSALWLVPRSSSKRVDGACRRQSHAAGPPVQHFYFDWPYKSLGSRTTFGQSVKHSVLYATGCSGIAPVIGLAEGDLGGTPTIPGPYADYQTNRSMKWGSARTATSTVDGRNRTHVDYRSHGTSDAPSRSTPTVDSQVLDAHPPWLPARGAGCSLVYRESRSMRSIRWLAAPGRDFVDKGECIERTGGGLARFRIGGRWLVIHIVTIAASRPSGCWLIDRS